MCGFSGANIDINLEDFSIVFDKEHKGPEMAVHASPSGHVTLNKYFIEDINKRTGSLEFGLYTYDKDKTVFVLSTKGPFQLQFPAQRNKKDSKFTQSLIASGVILPAKYEIKWNDTLSSWVGVLCSNTSKNALWDSIKGKKDVKENEAHK